MVNRDAFAARTGDWLTPEGKNAFVSAIEPTDAGTVTLLGEIDNCGNASCHFDHPGTPFVAEITREQFEKSTGGWIGPIG